MGAIFRKAEVASNMEISKDIFVLSIEGDFNGLPGQFYMLRSWGYEPLLSRPVSIYDIDNGKITFLYEVKGIGTGNFKSLKKGDSIELMGPLGNGFDMENIKGPIAIVSGGIGIAPMYYLAKCLKGLEINLYAGFRDRDYLIDKFEGIVQNIYISTDSGKTGHKGFITEVFNPSKYNLVLCCGPEIMMARVSNMCIEAGVPIYVSMERHMACGIGACLVCTCSTGDGNKRVCKDGPVFSGKDVIFNA